MKKFYNILFLMLTFALIGCSGVRPNGDEEAVLIKKPWFFGSGGVDGEPVSSGLTWTALSTKAVTFKIVPITYHETFDDMMTSDNTPVDFSVHVMIRIKSGMTPVLYEKFGEEWYTNSMAQQIKTTVRDKTSPHKMFDLTSNRDTLQKIETSIFKDIVAYCNKNEIPVEVMSVVVGKATPPPEVMEETRRTAAQNQSILTQRARAHSEAARKEAEINKAIADKAYKNEMGMNTNEYMQLRGLEIEKEKIELVREKQNVTIVMGQGLSPMIDVSPKK